MKLYSIKLCIHLMQVSTKWYPFLMLQYPKSIMEFEREFSNGRQCIDYLMKLRYPDGIYTCPACGSKKSWPVRKCAYECAECHHQVSILSGTLFQDAHKPLMLWFRAIWHITSQKNGASALGLQRVLGKVGYKTAWTWLHKLRRAMVRPGRDRLSGQVGVDEAYMEAGSATGEPKTRYWLRLLRK
jgi:hypothetical protein